MYPIVSRYLLPILLGLTMTATAQGADTPVRLVLVIVVDQLRPDRLSADLPGGLGRLMREGRVYVDAALDHAVTNTCPGHAVVLTGKNPASMGIIGNDGFDRAAWAPVYCVADDQPDARVAGHDYGRSPRAMLATTLGDWLKAADPTSRVVSISIKDRAAITLGGQHPDKVYWFDSSTGQMTTSDYYRSAGRGRPGWVNWFNGTSPLVDGYLSTLPAQWVHPTGTARPDDFAAEDDKFGRQSPHPLGEGALEDIAGQFYASPWADRAVGEMARLALVEEKLGQGEGTDLLAISFSATDTIGHRYGPFSAEAADALQVLDEVLDELLDVVYAGFDPDEVVIALTADHGVATLPEWDGDPLTPRCAAEPGRITALPLIFSIYGRLYWHFTLPFGNPFDLVAVAGPQVYVNEVYAAELGVDSNRVVAFLEQYLESLPYIERAWRALEFLQADPQDELARLYRNSWFEGRSGDLVIQNAPGCLIAGEFGTTHGTPYDYDRRVPLIFQGKGFVPGPVAGQAASVDIAPTLAPLLGVPVPGDLQGRNLLDPRQ
ncbi:MAG: alkaline phosphatase family protein [Pseudomonadota bacterium]